MTDQTLLFSQRNNLTPTLPLQTENFTPESIEHFITCLSQSTGRVIVLFFNTGLFPAMSDILKDEFQIKRNILKSPISNRTDVSIIRQLKWHHIFDLFEALFCHLFKNEFINNDIYYVGGLNLLIDSTTSILSPLGVHPSKALINKRDSILYKETSSSRCFTEELNQIFGFAGWFLVITGWFNAKGLVPAPWRPPQLGLPP
jgi:hypothetical protein